MLPTGARRKGCSRRSDGCRRRRFAACAGPTPCVGPPVDRPRCPSAGKRGLARERPTQRTSRHTRRGILWRPAAARTFQRSARTWLGALALLGCPALGQVLGAAADRGSARGLDGAIFRGASWDRADAEGKAVATMAFSSGAGTKGSTDSRGTAAGLGAGDGSASGACVTGGADVPSASPERGRSDVAAACTRAGSTARLTAVAPPKPIATDTAKVRRAIR